MKVKEYLVNRLVEVERDLNTSANNYANLMKELRDTNARCENYIDELDHYQMEREHIKQIITCNIVEDPYCAGRYSMDLLSNEDDFKTLLAILDIKPEDYSESQKELVHEFDGTKPNCNACIHKDISIHEEPCTKCGNYRNFERRTEDAENTD